VAAIAGILAQAKDERSRLHQPGLATRPKKPMPHLHPFKLSVIAAILMALLLVGCGKKGPLYLPDSPRKPDQKQSQN
jgi:predicted small lipoprotein YifL